MKGKVPLLSLGQHRRPGRHGGGDDDRGSDDDSGSDDGKGGDEGGNNDDLEDGGSDLGDVVVMMMTAIMMTMMTMIMAMIMMAREPIVLPIRNGDRSQDLLA